MTALAHRNLLARAECLLSRSGQWGHGLDEKRIETFAKAIVKNECLRTIMIKTDIPMLMAGYLVGLELEEKFHREWLMVKRLLRKRREKIRARTSSARRNAWISRSLKMELSEIDKYLEWMKLGPRTPAGASSPGSKPFLYSRWHALRQMEEHLVSSYRTAVLSGLSWRFGELVYTRQASPKMKIPEWAKIESLPKLSRKECSETLACILKLSPLTRMSAGSILRGLQRHYPVS